MPSRILSRAAALIYPPRCIICQELVAYDELFCGSCSLERADEREVAGKLGDVRGAALFRYGDGISNAILSMKRYRDARATDWFAGRLAELAACWGDGFDAVTCVPSSTAALRRRGFNHAAALGKAVAERMALPFLPGLLSRDRHSRTQRTLSLEERFENAARSYRVKQPDMAVGRRLLLVDDVITTGATALACVNALKEAGARDAAIIAICSTDRYDGSA